MLHVGNVLIKIRYESAKGVTYKLWELRPAQSKGDDHTAFDVLKPGFSAMGQGSIQH